MNARDNLKPKSIRVAILQALADGAITTIDDLQTKLDEPRKKVVDNAVHAANDGLIKRLRDDVTSLAAYKITTEGKAYLVKYASGKEEAPADVVEAVVVEKAVITPRGQTDIPRVESIDEAHKKAVMAWEMSMMAAIGEDGISDVVKAIDKIKAERDTARMELAAWESMANVFACTTPCQIADRISGLDDRVATFNQPLVVGYVIQRPAKPLVRFTKANSAETRAMAFARTGQRAQVFALTLVGTAIPGAEWKKA